MVGARSIFMAMTVWAGGRTVWAGGIYGAAFRGDEPFDTEGAVMSRP